MGFCMVGGELGRTLGPILLVTALAYITLENLPWLMVGGWATSAMLFLRLRRIPGRNPDARSGLPWGAAVRSMRPLMLPLSGILIARSFMSASLTTYLPTLLTERGVNLWFAGAGLTLLEGAGVVGAIVGGSLSDRVGRRIILLVSMLGTPLFMLAFLVSGDIGQAILLPVMGFVSLSGAPVIMAWVQESYPKNRALANGIYMGMSFLIQAVVAVILGRIGDLAGLEQGMLLSAILMVMAIPLVFIMPRRRVAAGAA
jgi:FSR family fosmidomycin resistance protein-like MFS transporter